MLTSSHALPMPYLLIVDLRSLCLQVSVRSDAHMARLTRASFKHSVDTYWITSLEAPDQLWSEELAGSSTEVVKFKSRSHDGCPVQCFSTFGDTYEHFLGQWDSRVSLDHEPSP